MADRKAGTADQGPVGTVLYWRDAVMKTLKQVLEPITGPLTKAELRELLELATDDIRTNRIMSPIQNRKPSKKQRTTLADLIQIVKVCVILLNIIKKTA